MNEESTLRTDIGRNARLHQESQRSFEGNAKLADRISASNFPHLAQAQKNQGRMQGDSIFSNRKSSYFTGERKSPALSYELVSYHM